MHNHHYAEHRIMQGLHSTMGAALVSAATTASPSRHAASLPAIDSRMVAFEDVVRLAVRGPMVAVGEEASPPPYHALSFAPLGVVAQAYRAAGAEVFNVPGLASPAA